jgi:KTSC domain
MTADTFTLASSNLDGGAYDPDTKMLIIRFKNGGEYSYSNVPEDVVEGLKSAGSPGRYFAAYIKTAYSYTRMA